MLFVNFKSSYEGTGERAISLVKLISEIQIGLETEIIPVLHDFDVFPARKFWSGQIWVQHAEEGYGKTGASSPETIKGLGLGINGVLLNHSEKKFSSIDLLFSVIDDCRHFELKTLVFASNLEEFDKVIRIRPDFIAYEPPELIGSKETSIAREKVDEILRASELAKEHNVPLLVGAGIKNREDVLISRKLGATGVIASSAIIKANDKGLKIREIIGGFGEKV